MTKSRVQLALELADAVPGLGELDHWRGTDYDQVGGELLKGGLSAISTALANVLLELVDAQSAGGALTKDHAPPSEGSAVPAKGNDAETDSSEPGPGNPAQLSGGEAPNVFSPEAQEAGWNGALKILEDAGEDVPALIAQGAANIARFGKPPPEQPKRRFTAPEPLPVGAKVRIVEMETEPLREHHVGALLTVIDEENEPSPLPEVYIWNKPRTSFYTAGTAGGEYVSAVLCVELVEEQPVGEPDGCKHGIIGACTQCHDDKLRHERFDLRERIHKLESELSAERAVTAELRGTVQRLNDRLDSVLVSAKSYENAAGKARADLHDCQALLKDKDRQLSENQQLRRDLSERMATAERDLAQYRLDADRKCVELADVATTLEAKLTVAEREKFDALERVKGLEGKLSAAGQRATDAMIDESELVHAREKLEKQQRQLASLNESNRRRNIELDAMRFVWCSGGCDGGAARWSGETITAEHVAIALRNAVRLHSWFVNHSGHQAPGNVEARQPVWGNAKAEVELAYAAKAQKEIDSLQSQLAESERQREAMAGKLDAVSRAWVSLGMHGRAMVREDHTVLHGALAALDATHTQKQGDPTP